MLSSKRKPPGRSTVKPENSNARRELSARLLKITTTCLQNAHRSDRLRGIFAPDGTQLATFAHMRLTHLLCGFRLDAQLRRRAQQQARQPDRFTGFPAVAVLAVLQSRQRRIDFRQQAAFAIQLAEQQAQILFARRLVGFIARRFAAVDLFFSSSICSSSFCRSSCSSWRKTPVEPSSYNQNPAWPAVAAHPVTS